MVANQLKVTNRDGREPMPKTRDWFQTYGRKSMVVPPDLGLTISTGKFFEEVTITIEKLHTKPLQQVVLCITIYLLVLMMNYYIRLKVQSRT